MTTALATRHAALAAFGSDDERSKILPILAESIGIPASEVKQPHVLGTLLKVHNWMETFGIVPGIHVDTMPRNNNQERRKDYILVPTYRWAIHNLAQHNKANRTQLQVIYKPATPEQIKTMYASMTQTWDKYTYDSRDPGQWAALVDMALGVQTIKDMMKMEEELEVQFFSWCFGTYRHSAKDGKPENLPATDTPLKVAQRRAAKKAINAIVPPYPIIHREDARLSYAMSEMKGTYDETHRLPTRGERAILQAPQTYMDEDGFIVDAPVTVVSTTQQHSSTPAQGKQDEGEGEIPFTDPLDLLQCEDITPVFSQWLTALRATNAKEGVKAMTEKAYLTLVKVVKTLVGGEQWEQVDADDLLSAIFAATICIETLPNHLAGNAIFAAIMTERAAKDEQGGFKRVDNKPVYETNPEYNKQIVTGFQWAYEKVKPLEW